jgi:hypothetical protein
MKTELVIGGIYRHYKKGAAYKVVGVAKHSETLEDMVVYQEQHSSGELWVRPLGMFLERVETEGGSVPRFELIAGAE